ncbi:MAG: hypothetical protein HY232_09830 [Acidobacteria bacterium]|nr:hypothetical protein [Acidobacteriota bacterium]
MRTLWGWIERYGLPKALYVDHKNVYLTAREPTREEELRGEQPRTHFGRACQKLGIAIIGAHSPVGLPRPGDPLTVSQWLDGSIHLLYKGRPLKYKELPERPRLCRGAVVPKLPRKKYIPRPDHP